MSTTATYFWSGSNHAGEIAGLSATNEHIGVAIHGLDRKGRSMRQLMAQAAGPRVRVVANVQRNSSGRPIIMITRDRALLPDGDVDVTVGGERYRCGFRKIAVNTAYKAAGAANALASLLRRMFGRDAGAKRDHKVVIELTHVGWNISKQGLQALAGSGSQVFVDSGAFSEVSFAGGERKVVRPIDHAEWERRLAKMTQIAEALGSKAYLVAPDAVGDQQETLERLQRYAHVVRRWRDVGANVIVPIQKGPLPQAQFDRECAAILGFSDYVRGIPSKKAAATTAEIVELVASLPVGSRVHLLGLGPSSPRYAEIMGALPEGRPVFCDSVGIKRLVGRTNGKGGGPRALTAIRDLIVADWGLSGRLPFADTFRVKAEMMRRYFASQVEGQMAFSWAA